MLMISFVALSIKGKARSDMTVEERIGAADRRKMDGNALFKEEKLEEAMQQYEMVMLLYSQLNQAINVCIDDSVECLVSDDDDFFFFWCQAIAYMGDDFMFQLFGKYRDMALAVKNPCHLNMAACLIKLKRYEEAIGHCSIVRESFL